MKRCRDNCLKKEVKTIGNKQGSKKVFFHGKVHIKDILKRLVPAEAHWEIAYFDQVAV